ncbi:MAG: efflux RND transporter periplasmic adaptor subunit [Pantoea sp.]|uniref:efflux RND transporter periplasmic adaptor subunit n=1 Tax=Pantoea TaxID=53335 RepID=UPI000F88BB98|nr:MULTISPECIES: efflux RND transporter periplasmic adaptor subunit [Pantoea]MDU6433188.1 efflux RND transporter periplasmic adaptor subunit [Pantoea sp.]RTY56591.1 efflux RND transporter periplasmic adaptor subunit [Pantoea sp. YU22]
MRLKFLSASVVFLLVACDQGGGQPAASSIPQVGVTTVKSQPVTLMKQLPGRTNAVKTAEVRPQVSGVIQKLLFTEGGEVKAGQPLYQIDPATYKAAYDKALATWQNDAMVAKRYQPLAAAHAISQQTYDDAVAAERSAKADLETARVNLDYTLVKAPIAGHISRSLVTAGALVTNGQTDYLATIQQLDPIYVDVSESVADLLSLRRAMAQGKLEKVDDNTATVKLQLEDGSTYPLEGKLAFSEVNVSETTGTVVLRAIFPNPHNELLPGMYVHAVFPQGVQQQGILLPQEAIMHDAKGQPYVYVVKPDSSVEQRNITTGEMVKGNWLVNSGLKSGEQVIVNGLQSVRSGIKVNAQAANSQDTPAAGGVSLSMTDPSAQ